MKISPSFQKPRAKKDHQLADFVEEFLVQLDRRFGRVLDYELYIAATALNQKMKLSWCDLAEGERTRSATKECLLRMMKKVHLDHQGGRTTEDVSASDFSSSSLLDEIQVEYTSASEVGQSAELELQNYLDAKPSLIYPCK